MIITRPMKPYKMTSEELHLLRYPLLATPKLDGIRCTKINGKALTATHKPIPNLYIRSLIENSTLPDGFDGELLVPGTFQDTLSAVMSVDGTPPFTWQMFDYISNGPYEGRIIDLQNWFNFSKCAFAQPVLPDVLRNGVDFLNFEDAVNEEGYEGMCMRRPDGLYKNGRSTLKEQGLLAVKRFIDAEATVIGITQLMHNENPAETNELGLTKRSSDAAGQVGTMKMGALQVINSEGVRFKLGSGFTQAQREAWWQHPEAIIGKIVTYKSVWHGVKDAPRNAVFKAIRG
jgi:DNA ligase 1